MRNLALPAKAGMGKCIRRAEAQGLGWPLPDSLDDAGLERRLFPAPAPSARLRPVPRWSEVHRELRRKGVTLALLWEEYTVTHPEGLQSSGFCEQYQAWASKLDVVMRQEHRAGEKLFVDSAGHTVGVVDRRTGELLPERRSSSRCWGRRATSPRTRGPRGRRAWGTGWRRMRAFEFFGGCPERVVPDNLRAAVSRAHPPAYAGADTNPTYHDLARHYGVAVLPARVRRLRDKAKVEACPRMGESGGERAGGRALDSRRPPLARGQAFVIARSSLWPSSTRTRCASSRGRGPRRTLFEHSTAPRFIRWAEKVGPHTAALITTGLGSRRHPQQAFRS